ncbi:MAG: hypothetical protein ACR2NM_05825 [Bythopirellula sp.]
MNTLWKTAIPGLLLLYSTLYVDVGHAQLVDELLLQDTDVELLAPGSEELPSQKDESSLVELGGDIGALQSANTDWLGKIIKHMEFAQIGLARPLESGQASVAQSAALAELDALIGELAERKNQSSGGNSDTTGSPQSGEQLGASGQAGSKPGETSSTSDSRTDLSTELAVASELVKDLWGQLPERQREQILQPLSEEFLPKYASEIEAYFRALADPNRTVVESP